MRSVSGRPARPGNAIVTAGHPVPRVPSAPGAPSRSGAPKPLTRNCVRAPRTGLIASGTGLRAPGDRRPSGTVPPHRDGEAPPDPARPDAARCRRHRAHAERSRTGRPAGHLHLSLRSRRDERAGRCGRFCSSTKFTASTRPSRTASCRTWKTARSPSSARRRKTPPSRSSRPCSPARAYSCWKA